MFLSFITPVEIGLAIGFICTLAGSVWFCLTNYVTDIDIDAEHN